MSECSNNQGLTGVLQALTTKESEDAALELRNQILRLIEDFWKKTDAGYSGNNGWSSYENGHFSILHCVLLSLLGAVKSSVFCASKSEEDYIEIIDIFMQNLPLSKNPFIEAISRMKKNDRHLFISKYVSNVFCMQKTYYWTFIKRD